MLEQSGPEPKEAQKTRTRFRKLMHLEEDTETPVIRRRYDVK